MAGRALVQQVNGVESLQRRVVCTDGTLTTGRRRGRGAGHSATTPNLTTVALAAALPGGPVAPGA